MDRRRRYYSVTVVPEAPGGFHADGCPCCVTRARIEDGCRQAVGMNGAGLSHRTIERQLSKWLNGYETACVMQFVESALPGAPLTHHWHAA